MFSARVQGKKSINLCKKSSLRLLWKNKTGRRPESSSPTAEKGALQRKCLAAAKRKASFPFGRIVFCCMVKRYVKKHGCSPDFLRLFCSFCTFCVGKYAFRCVIRIKKQCDTDRIALQYGLCHVWHAARRMAQSARPCRHRNYASTSAAAASCAARWSR